MRGQNRKPVPHSARTNGTKNGQAFNHAKRVLGLGSRTKRLRDGATHGLCSGTIPLCSHSGKLDRVIKLSGLHVESTHGNSKKAPSA